MAQMLMEMTELPEEFLRGVALFNEGRFFECHEVWEIIWLKAEGDEREFLHAMIQVAAALVHLQRGNLKGAQSVSARAIGKLRKLPDKMMLLDTREFLWALEQFLLATDSPFPRIKLQDEFQNGHP
jgi:predicted metal-dependent hydrolase